MNLPMTFAVATTKGGAGKSTTAVALAELLALEAGPTTLVDLDPQASTTMWSMAAAQNGRAFASTVVQPDFSMSPARMPRATVDAIRDSQYAVIDTPPGNVDLIEAAVETVAMCGGIVIIPTPAASLDAVQALSMLKRIDGRVPVVIFLNKARTNTRKLRKTRQELTELGVPVLNSEVKLLEAVSDAGNEPFEPDSRFLQLFRPVAMEALSFLTAPERATA